MEYQPERALIQQHIFSAHLLCLCRNGVPARKGIDTQPVLLSCMYSYLCRNGVPARKGIDTTDSSLMLMIAMHSRNVASARKGIDTFCVFNGKDNVYIVEMEYQPGRALILGLPLTLEKILSS